MAELGENDIVTGIALSQYDQQGFLTETEIEPEPLFVPTTIQALASVYTGETLIDY